MSHIIWKTLVISNILYIHPLYKYVFSLHYSLKLLPNSLILPLKIFQIFGDYFWICSRLLKKSLQENFNFLYSKGESHIEKKCMMNCIRIVWTWNICLGWKLEDTYGAVYERKISVDINYWKSVSKIANTKIKPCNVFNFPC